MFSAISEPLARFHAAARRLLPGLELNQLRPGGSGIRARSAPAEQTFSDFLIRRDRRQPRLVQAAGIDSPGLTASLAIAERVADLVDETTCDRRPREETERRPHARKRKRSSCSATAADGAGAADPPPGDPHRVHRPCPGCGRAVLDGRPRSVPG